MATEEGILVAAGRINAADFVILPSGDRLRVNSSGRTWRILSDTSSNALRTLISCVNGTL